MCSMASSSIILSAVTLLLVLSRVRSSNYMNVGICSEGDNSCLELGEGELCRTRTSEQTERLNNNICSGKDELQEQELLNRQCDYDAGTSLSTVNTLKQSCSSVVSEVDWPVLSYSLIHVDKYNFNVRIHWELPIEVNITGYALLISLKPWNSDLDHNNYLKCAAIDLPVNSTGFLYSHIQGYHLGEPVPEEFRDRQIYIKLLPHGWCDGPQVSFVTPESCHSLCPGACNVCGSDHQPLVPTNLSVSHCQRSDNSTTLTLSWQSQRLYFSLYRNQTYYIAVYEGGSRVRPSKPVSRQIEVVGKTSVVLQNLSFLQDKVYHIRVRAYDCSCSKSESIEFEIGGTPLQYCDSDAVWSINTTTPEVPDQTNNSTQPSPTNIVSSSATYSLSLSVHTSTSSYSTQSLLLIPTVSPVQPAPFHHHSWAVFSVLFVFIALAFILLIIITSTVVYRLRHHKSARLETSTGVLSPVKQHTTDILLVYSLNTPEDEVEYVLVNFAQALSLYGVRVLFYDMTYGCVGTPQWMESSITKCSKVFLLCNSQFKKEWDNSEVNLEGNLIHILKQNFFAHVKTNSDYMSKYALLFPRAGPVDKNVASCYLHNLQRFLVDPEDPARLEQVIKFITNCKTYEMEC